MIGFTYQAAHFNCLCHTQKKEEKNIGQNDISFV